MTYHLLEFEIRSQSIIELLVNENCGIGEHQSFAHSVHAGPAMLPTLCTRPCLKDRAGNVSPAQERCMLFIETLSLY